MARITPALLLALAFPLRGPAMESQAKGPCDLAKIEKSSFCPKCDKFLEKDEVKSEKCTTHNEKVKTLEACVKHLYVADCHPVITGSKPVTCCGKLFNKGTPNRARITYKCETCGESAETAKEIKHKDCKAKKPKPQCQKSGTPPHAT